MSSSEEIGPSCFSKRLLLHFINGTFLIILVIVQGSILNYYIIANFKNNVHPYFWFIADFVCVFIFAGTLTVSYQFLGNKMSSNPSEFLFSPKNIVSKKFPTRKLGVMPLSYISWLFYSLILFAKLIMIFTSNIPKEISPKDVFGTQLLQITIALSGIIFLLLVEGHNESNRHSARNMFVTHVCGKTAIEILDTVNILALLLVQESNLPLTFTLETTVLVLGSMDFLLPTLALYKLSLSNVNFDNLFLPMSIIYSILHLIMIDVPFLTLRMYLWCKYQRKAHIFLMKNVFGILIAVRTITLDLKDFIENYKTEKQPNPPKQQKPKNETDEIELESMTRNAVEA